MSCGRRYLWVSWGGFPFCPRRSSVSQRPRLAIRLLRGGWVCSIPRSPIAFLGSFALAAPALQLAFQQHGESLGPILRDELGALPTKRALCDARNELDPKARKVLPPFDVGANMSALHMSANMLVQSVIRSSYA